MWQIFAEFADYLNENQGLLTILSVLFGLGGSLILYRMPFRAWGIGLLIAAIIGTIALIAGRYLISTRALYGFEGMRVLIPNQLSKVRRDTALRERVESEFRNAKGAPLWPDFTCTQSEKAFDVTGQNSAQLTTKYVKIPVAQALAENCPRVDNQSAANQAVWNREFARILAAREQLDPADVEVKGSPAWLGDKFLGDKPMLGGCRTAWAARGVPYAFFDVFIAMPRFDASNVKRCSDRGTFTAHLVLRAQNPNQILMLADYTLMWETVWAPLRARLKAMNGGMDVPVIWGQEPAKAIAPYGHHDPFGRGVTPIQEPAEPDNDWPDRSD